VEELEIVETIEAVEAVPVLDMPLARLQIVQADQEICDGWPRRSDVEPVLAQNADGLWLLTIRRQGKHGTFALPYIGTEILLADAEAGFLVVLTGYHGTEAVGRRGDKHLVKGQFYRFYRQEASGEWRRFVWRELGDEVRQMVLDLPRPEWARAPGKLSTERKPPAKAVERISYKVVRVIGGRYYSLYQPDVEYVIGQRMKQAAKPCHSGGYFSWPTQADGEDFLEGCVRSMPFPHIIKTPAVALVECEIGGRIIDYGHKLCSTYLCLVRVLEVRDLIG